jgi:hypothetical protein
VKQPTAIDGVWREFIFVHRHSLFAFICYDRWGQRAEVLLHLGDRPLVPVGLGGEGAALLGIRDGDPSAVVSLGQIAPHGAI